METTGTFIRSEREMADYLDNGAVGLHWVAADGTILWANRADYEPLGYSREEYVGHNIAEFHANPSALEAIFQRLAAGETLYNYRVHLRRKNGTLQDVLIASSVLFDDAGNFVHTRCFTMLAPANA